VTIATTTKVRAGLAGQVEAWLTTRLLRPIYQRELAQLATFITQLSGSPGEVKDQQSESTTRAQRYREPGDDEQPAC
jgi:hypothetical protein